MSTESGRVQKIENGWAWVMTERKDACDHCGQKPSCNMIEGIDRMLVKATNSAKAGVGDYVELFLSTKTKMKGMLILYILPVIGLLVGALSSGSLSKVFGLNQSFGTVLFTFMGVVIAFVLVRVLGIRMDARQELTPAVLRIIRRARNSFPSEKVKLSGSSSDLANGGRRYSPGMLVKENRH